MQKLIARDVANLHSMVHRLMAAKCRGLPVPFSHRALEKWHKELIGPLFLCGMQHRRGPSTAPIRGQKR